MAILLNDLVEEFGHGPYWTPEGHRAAADAILETMRSEQLIPATRGGPV